MISRSFESLARCVRIRIPTEHTFSVVVRSTSSALRELDISTGTASRIRFSSRPDRAGICELTFKIWFRWLASGSVAPKSRRNQPEF
jgi:hypothetical protein